MSADKISTSQLRRVACFAVLVGLCSLFAGAVTALADETCNSPYLSSLIKGQEDYAYVWTLGVPGVGDGWDKLVTIDVNPASPRYGS